MSIKSTIIFLFILTAFIAQAIAQNPDILWSKSYGGSVAEGARVIRPTIDGGYIVGGGIAPIDNESKEISIIKLDDTGEIQWQQFYGGSEYETLYQIEQTVDGGYLFAGTTNSPDGDITGLHGESDGWVVKIDSIGDIQWQRCYGGTSTDGIYSFVVNGNSYAFLGVSFSTDGDLSNTINHGSRDAWLLTTDSVGNILSSNSYGSSGHDQGVSICNSSSGEYVLLCYGDAGDGDVSNSNYHGAYDYWVLIVNSAGQIQYSRCFGGSYQDWGESILCTSDGGYAIAGNSASKDGDVTGHHGTISGYIDYWVIKLDSTGFLLWEKSLGGSVDDYCYSIIESSGNLFVAGYSKSNDGDVVNNHGDLQRDGWIVKLSGSGDILWQSSYGGSLDETIYSIAQSMDGTYVCAGSSQSSNGDLPSNNGGFDYWIFKLAATTSIKEPVSENSFLVFPNPASDVIHFKNSNTENGSVTLTDLLGHVVYSQQFRADEIFDIDISKYPGGIYFFVVTQGLTNQVQKVILE